MEEQATQEKTAEQISAQRASSARQGNEAKQADEAWKSMRCSDFGNEALPGTAKSMTLFLAVEYLKGWGRDIMDDDVLGDLTAPLKKVLKDNGASMQFIRKPGRAGQFRDERKLYIARTDQGTCFTTRISGVEDLLHLDIQALADGTWGRSELPARPVERVNHPIMLVCTHGKRDLALQRTPLRAHHDPAPLGILLRADPHRSSHRRRENQRARTHVPHGLARSRMLGCARADRRNRRRATARSAHSSRRQSRRQRNDRSGARKSGKRNSGPRPHFVQNRSPSRPHSENSVANRRHITRRHVGCSPRAGVGWGCHGFVRKTPETWKNLGGTVCHPGLDPRFKRNRHRRPQLRYSTIGA